MPTLTCTTPQAGVLVTVVGLAITFAPCKADTLHVPGEYGTIQDAIDAARDGDVVLVADGVYTGPGNRDLDFVGKIITVRSENGPTDCIIDCQADDLHPHRGFHFHNGETAEATVTGFTIRGGSVDFGAGGAILCESSSPTIIDCIIRENRVFLDSGGAGGGGVACLESAVTLAGCVIEQNYTDGTQGGGVYSRGGLTTIIDCIIRENFASIGGDGGGVACRESAVTLAGCVIEQNIAEEGQGGGVYSWGGLTTIIYCTIKHNLSGWDGGGVYGERVALEGCTIADNHVAYEGGCAGGGVWCKDDSVIRDCTITGNYSDGVGGGIACWNATVERCEVVGNKVQAYHAYSSGNEGGGLYASDTVVLQCVIRGNTLKASTGAFMFAEPKGGGARCYGGLVAGCLISGNTVGPPSEGSAEGGGLACSADTTVINCTITANSALGDPSSGGGVCGEAHLVNCILWDDQPNEICPDEGMVVSYSDIEGGWEGVGNIDRKPLFVDPAQRDYRIAAGSPVIDAGNNSAVPPQIDPDLDGQARFVDDRCTADTGSGSPPLVDMGAYEFQPSELCDDDDGDSGFDDSAWPVSDPDPTDDDGDAPGSAQGVVDVGDLTGGLCPVASIGLLASALSGLVLMTAGSSKLRRK